MSSNLSGSGASAGVVQVGIVGMGAAARPFIPAILAHPGFKLAAIAEPDADVRTSVIAEHDMPGYATIEAMLQYPGLEAVYIATPTDLHAKHVALACAAGKHVLVEKPMATSVEQAKAMIACAERDCYTWQIVPTFKAIFVIDSRRCHESHPAESRRF